MSGTYFSHDSSARGDEKIIALRMKYGWQGYGLYWALIEKLVEATCYELAVDYNLLAFDLRTDASLIKSIINEFGLFAFAENGECFYSESLLKRMQLRDEKSKKLSAAGRKGIEKKLENQGWLKGGSREAQAINKEINKSIKEINEKKDFSIFSDFLAENKILNPATMEFLCSDDWIDEKSTQLGIDPIPLIEKAKEFLIEQLHIDKIEGREIEDLRTHFVNWVKKKKSLDPVVIAQKKELSFNEVSAKCTPTYKAFDHYERLGRDRYVLKNQT